MNIHWHALPNTEHQPTWQITLMQYTQQPRKTTMQERDTGCLLSVLQQVNISQALTGGTLHGKHEKMETEAPRPRMHELLVYAQG
jgi:hypothetical protein